MDKGRSLQVKKKKFYNTSTSTNALYDAMFTEKKIKQSLPIGDYKHFDLCSSVMFFYNLI